MEAITTTSVTVGSPKEYKPTEDNLVDVTIRYPKDWGKEKFFSDGDVKSVSPETAAQFAEIGIIEIPEPVKEQVKADKKAK